MYVLACFLMKIYIYNFRTMEYVYIKIHIQRHIYTHINLFSTKKKINKCHHHYFLDFGVFYHSIVYIPNLLPMDFSQLFTIINNVPITHITHIFLQTCYVLSQKQNCWVKGIYFSKYFSETVVNCLLEVLCQLTLGCAYPFPYILYVFGQLCREKKLSLHCFGCKGS